VADDHEAKLSHRLSGEHIRGRDTLCGIRICDLSDVLSSLSTRQIMDASSGTEPIVSEENGTGGPIQVYVAGTDDKFTCERCRRVWSRMLRMSREGRRKEDMTYQDRPEYVAPPEDRCQAKVRALPRSNFAWMTKDHQCPRKANQMRGLKAVCYQHASAKKVEYWGGE